MSPIVAKNTFKILKQRVMSPRRPHRFSGLHSPSQEEQPMTIQEQDTTKRISEPGAEAEPPHCTSDTQTDCSRG